METRKLISEIDDRNWDNDYIENQATFKWEFLFLKGGLALLFNMWHKYAREDNLNLSIKLGHS